MINELRGLRCNNLLGYLAALGVVRLIPGARLGWDLKGSGCAVLDGVDDPVAALAESLKHPDPYKRLVWLTKKSDENVGKIGLSKKQDELKNRLAEMKDVGEEKDALKAELKALETALKTIKDKSGVEAFAGRRKNAPEDWGQDPEDTLWMHALWTPDGNSNSLNLTGGGNSQTGFFGALAESRNQIRSKAVFKIEEALFGPWRHEDNIGSFYWDYESIGYAPKHIGITSPEHNKRSVAAAQWLAGEGLPVIGSVEGNRVDLPLWKRPEPCSIIIERMKHHVAEQWMMAEKFRLPGPKGRHYWYARTSCDRKNLAGSRKIITPEYKDLYSGSELWCYSRLF